MIGSGERKPELAEARRGGFLHQGEESSEEGGQMVPEWRKGGGPGWPPGCGGLVRDRREPWIVPGFSGLRLENGMMNPHEK